MEKETKKMTLEEYQKKYSKPVNAKAAKTFLFLFAAGIGVIIFFCLFSIVMKMFEIHQYAGYASVPFAVVIFILIYVVPLVKITKTKAFITNVDARNAREAQRYNQALREEIADKMIDFNVNTEGVTWYSDEKVGALALARQTKDKEGLKNALSTIYDTDVKAAANKMIRDHAFKVGLTTALSQSEKVDTLFVCMYDLSLIKDIIFLYGFRPSDTQLMKIYQTVIADAVIAYGLGNATGSMATAVASKVGSSIPIFGNAIGQILDSVAQGVINSSLTVAIGFQTKRYLVKEYHLQDILDNVVLSDEEEARSEVELMSSLRDDIAKTAKNSQKKSPLAA